jgi:hypothetical protein
MKHLNLTGQTFGRLTVIGEVRKEGRLYWLCRCACGGKTVLVGDFDLRNGKTTSCGCRQKELLRERVTTHGATSRNQTEKQKCIYESWQAMLKRCFNPKNKDFMYYGGRGIQVCAQWTVFPLFWRAMEATWFPGATLDRYPNNKGHYNRQNCRWATRAEQTRNTPHTKLTKETADWMRFCFEQLGWPRSILAECNRVSYSTVCLVLRRRTWRS